jgi:PAS domain S-box-containing protein
MVDLLQGRHARQLIALFALCACLHVDLDAQGRTSERSKRVLALHVVRRDTPGFDDTFRSILRAALSDRLDYYSEYIDLNRLKDDKYQSALRTYLRTRYVDDGLDLIIASGPSVVEFLNGDPSLFKREPIVFTTRPGVLGGPHSTGVVSAVDFTNTLSAALDAQPATKHIFVVSGIATFDRLYADLFKEQRKPFEARVAFHDLSGLTLPELQARVQQLPPDSIIFYVSVSDDGAGHTVMPLDAVDPIAAVANAPVYSWHEDALGHGIVGGRLHSSVGDARETAQIALRVLRGEKPESIPVATIDSYAYEFDGRQLRRWGIDEARLPPGSVIRYRELSFFDQYRSYVVSGGLIFIAQAALIGGLLIQHYRRRRAEDALRRSESHNSAILRALPDLMFVLDDQGRYVDFHARDPKMLFVSPDAFLGQTLAEVMPAELGQMFMAALEQARTSEEPVVVEYELPMDEVRHYEARLVRAGPNRIVSIVRDVTEARRATELNRALARRLILSQEQERQRIARELHDDLSQRIALLNLEVDQIADEVPAHGHRSRLEKVSSQVSEIADDLSNLSHKLHPSRLQTLGLTESVRLLCREISQHRQLKVQFSSVELPHGVDPGVALCLYRIAQEALHNIAKHSQARDASVHLTHEGDHVQLHIVDSGVGFDPITARHGGLGLLSMRERVGILRGKLVINASPGQGTRIGVSVPVSPSSEGPSPFTSV